MSLSPVTGKTCCSFLAEGDERIPLKSAIEFLACVVRQGGFFSLSSSIRNGVENCIFFFFPFFLKR